MRDRDIKLREKAELVVSVRITDSVDKRVKKLVDYYRMDHHVKVYRSAIICSAIEIGLKQLEKELKAPSSYSSKPSD